MLKKTELELKYVGWYTLAHKFFSVHYFYYNYMDNNKL